MKKKIAYMLIGALCTLILSYGFVAYADHDASAPTADKPAASGTYVVPSEDAAAVAPATAQPSAGEAPIQLEQLKALDIKIDGNNAKISIELEKEESKTESKVELKLDDRKQYLTGSEAIAFIRQLLAALKLQANMDKQQVMDALVQQFAIEPANVELKLDLKLKDRPDEWTFKEDKDDDDDDANVQTVRSTVPDNQKAQLAANNQLTKQAQKKALIAHKKALQQAWQNAHKEQQATKKQQTQWARGDRDDDHEKGKKDDEDENDQGEDHDRDGDHGQRHEHDEHDDEDRS